MSIKPAHARHRTDTGSAALIELLRASGVMYEPLGGAVDGMAWYRGQVRLIDFKRDHKSPLTVKQGKLLARDCPVHFIWNEDQVRLLVKEIKFAAQHADEHSETIR